MRLLLGACVFWRWLAYFHWIWNILCVYSSLELLYLEYLTPLHFICAFCLILFLFSDFMCLFATSILCYVYPHFAVLFGPPISCHIMFTQIVNEGKRGVVMFGLGWGWGLCGGSTYFNKYVLCQCCSLHRAFYKTVTLFCAKGLTLNYRLPKGRSSYGTMTILWTWLPRTVMLSFRSYLKRWRRTSRATGTRQFMDWQQTFVGCFSI